MLMIQFSLLALLVATISEIALLLLEENDKNDEKQKQDRVMQNTMQSHREL